MAVPSLMSSETRTMRSGRWLLALLLLGACAGGGVTPIRSHFNKGVYQYAQGDFEAAISEFRLALGEEPADHRARFNLAASQEALADRLERGGRPEAAEALRQEAESLYHELLAMRPDDLRVAVNLAAREIAKGNRGAGEDRLLRAIERQPRAVLPRTALAAHRIRLSEDDPDGLRQAIELLEAALAFDPANTDANLLLGHACELLARHGPDSGTLRELARQAYRKALEANSYDLATLLALGRLELTAGNAAAAVPWLRRALYVDADHLEGHLLMSQALEERGDLEGATLHLWRARELESPEAPKLSSAEYEERLLDLYRRLTEREQQLQ